MTELISRRFLTKTAFQATALGLFSSALGNSFSRPIGSKRLADAGWIWEGQGLVGGVDPSIFGVGEGARFFGLRKVCYMFHPNDDLGMEKLRDFDDVVCDIGKWKFRRCEDGTCTKPEGGGAPGIVPAVRLYRDGILSTVIEEAEQVSRLSLKYRNISGAIDDEMLNHIRHDGISPKQYGSIYNVLKKHNPRLKLWSVVFDYELKKENWSELTPYMDIINLWILNPKDFGDLDRDLAKCRDLFPEKPIVLGCYLRDFFADKPMPLDMLDAQWESVLRHIQSGTIHGFSILATCLIDGQPQQASRIRNFLGSH